MKRQKLPIGIQNFREIRDDYYYYVDKTGLALKLIEAGKSYFLSRPRRFGKSLFLDTLKELFEGNEPLFQGLAAHDQWDWSVNYPVLRFSFGGGDYSSLAHLKEDLDKQLSHMEQRFGIKPQFAHASGRFADLLVQLNKQLQLPVVVLVDEYDKPILDSLQNPEVARENRNFLRSFYGTIKDHDADVKFTFLTGVSKFSRVSLFSGLNNLKDITLDHRYSSLCGYTDYDIDTVFEPELAGLDRNEIRHWYNGYNWLGEGVYNPFDILQLFDNREFKNYWFESGTPTFLVDLIRARQVSTPDLARRNTDAELLSTFDVDKMPLEAVMFQTGYLTITEKRNLGGNWFYQLGYPNREVYQSLNNSLLQQLVHSPETQVSQRIRLYELLLRNDFEALKTLFHAFFASIPYHWYTNNDIQNFEGYYASIFYSYFAASGLQVIVEDSTNHGRLDMTLKFNQQVYLFEFKVVELTPEGNALQQIKDKKYADKYRGLNQPIHMIGVEFNKTGRNIVGFEVEQA